MGNIVSIVLVGSKKLLEYREEYYNEKIWCFEENKNKYNKLLKNLPNKVFLDNICISDYLGQSKGVDITTLYNLFINIDILVIDGYPDEVLRGLKKIRPDFIDCKKCNWLKKNGYRLVNNIYER